MQRAGSRCLAQDGLAGNLVTVVDRARMVRRVLVGGIGVLRAEDGDGAGEDDLRRRIGLGRRAHQRPHRRDVQRLVALGVRLRSAQIGARRKVDDRGRAAHQARPDRLVAEIGFDRFDIRARERRGRRSAGRPRHEPQRPALARKPPRQRRADVAARAGDDDGLHRSRSCGGICGSHAASSSPSRG